MPNDKPKSLSDWQPQGGAPLLPLAAPLNMASERAAPAPAPAPAKGPSPVVVGALAAVVAAAVTAGVMSALSSSMVVDPIVIVSVGARAPAPVEPAPAPAPAPKPMMVAAPKPVDPPAPAPAKKAAPAEPEEKKPSVQDAFAKVAALPPPPPDELTAAEVNQVVAAHRAQTEACAESQRAAEPDVSGALTVKWTVEPDGHVTQVTPYGEHAGTAFAKCVVKEVSSWSFPRHEAPHPPVEASFRF